MRNYPKLAAVFSALLISQGVVAQSGYSDALLNTKRQFSRMGTEALAVPFRGVATSEGIVEGLYNIASTGVSTAPVVDAASAFLATLNGEQLSRTQHAVDDPEWRNWSNVDIGIFARQGVSLEEMSPQQRRAAEALLRVSLSTRGLDTVNNVRKTEQTLLEINDDAIRYGEDKYYFTIMGVPSTSEPWGWQFDGHHLVLNYFILGDQVAFSPIFLGGEPTVTTTGMYAGNEIMQREQDEGLRFMQSLNATQRSKATVNPDKTRNDSIAAANEDNLTLDYQGIPGNELTGAQKQSLLDLVSVYVGSLTEGHAQVRMEEVGRHINDTYFSWVGASDDDAVFYYRIHSPVLLIEFDHQNPVGTPRPAGSSGPLRQHIHTVMRTPNGNDYGKDLLRQHLLAHPH